MDKAFLDGQKNKIIERLNRYHSKKRIDDELLAGDVSHYTKYKQKVLVPILEKTLKKFELGTYGICESCGKEIETARLLLVPAAEHCLSCKK